MLGIFLSLVFLCKVSTCHPVVGTQKRISPPTAWSSANLPDETPEEVDGDPVLPYDDDDGSSDLA